MKIQEKKTQKGNSFAIIKLSDLGGVFELFVFSEILENNRKVLKEGESFLINVYKDLQNQENRTRRITIAKITSLKSVINQKYESVTIELNKSTDLPKLSKVINEKGDGKVKISLNDNDKKYLFELKDKRKLDYKVLKMLKKEAFIKKISL